MRRRRSAAPSDDSSIDPNAPLVPSEPDEATTENAPPEQEASEAKPRRRPTARRKASPEAEAPAAAPEPSPAPEEEAPRRTPRRPKRSAAEPPAAEATPEAVPEEPAPPAETPRRRRGGRNAKAPEAPPASETAAPEETPSEEASEDSLKARRTRGLRRSRTVAAPSLMMAETPAEPTPAEPTADEDASTTEAPRARRTRGQRRARPAAPAELPPSAPEPLPPIYQPLPAEVLAHLPETRVVLRKGVAELTVNGEPRLPLLFFVNTEAEADPAVAQRQIRLAYENGVRIFTVLAHLPWRARTGERRYEPLDEALRFVAENAPEALILPRLIFSPPGSFVRTHPEDITRYASGEEGDISIGSRAFWESEAEEALQAAVEHVAQSEMAGRVIGFYLEHGEWLYEKGMGFDRSEANRHAYRAWLRTRYKNSVVALRAAWNDGSVAFETAEIPDWPPPEGDYLFFYPRERRWVDFHDYSSEIVAQVTTRLARAVKEASGNRAAVALSYGYTLEMPRAHSGHLALAQVLASPHIDILTGPISYAARTPGGSASLPAPIDSVTLAGKLWISEDDTKTFLAGEETPDGYNPKIATVEGMRAVHARNFGAALARGVGICYMDLWGEGWLDDRETWQFIGRLRELAEQLATRRRNPRTRSAPEPDVAVLVDERSFFGVRTESLLDRLVAGQRDVLLRSGARVGFYLLSDLTRKSFPMTPRLLLFLNAFQLEPAVKAAIRERFQDEGRTLAWLYGPGACEENLAELTDVIGMQLKLQPWGSKMGAHVLSQTRSALTDGMRGQRIGEEIRVNPSFCAIDPKAQVLAEYSDGHAAIAVRKHPRWQSVFLGEPELPLPLLRGLYRLAGVPTFTVDDDVAWIGDSFVCLHSAPGGGTTLYLPEEAALYDALHEEALASSGRGARLSMPPRGTRLLFWGSSAEIARLGGDASVAAPGLSEEELPAPAAPFVFESPSTLPVTEISAEDEALFAAALATDELTDKESDEIDETEAETEPEEESVADAGAAESAEEPRRRRRRRRRGRGRGADTAETPQEIAESVLELETDLAPSSSPENGSGKPRPTLEELLPLSEAPAGTELPPLPDEFLSHDAAPPADAPPGASRRRRRGGRGRGPRGEESKGDEAGEGAP